MYTVEVYERGERHETTDPAVDDDINIAKLVKLYLEKDGYEVVHSARGDDALAQLKKLSPALILLDIKLPGMDGWQVCAIRLQKQGAHHHAQRQG